MSKNPFVVLMAEDDEHDIVAIKRVWEKCGISNPLYIVNDGEECLDYLYQRGEYSRQGIAPRPSILLLDIKMPKTDGLTILKHIRKSENFHSLPVIIFTTSEDEEDLLNSYDLGATAYIVKPVGFDKLSEVVNTIINFWKLVQFPEEHHGNKYR